MIKQIINPNQIIQTELAVEVDGIRFDYRRIPGKFAYEFIFNPYIIGDKLKPNFIEAAIDQIVDAMCEQSLDRGSEWEDVGIRKTSFDPRTGEYSVIVYFNCIF